MPLLTHGLSTGYRSRRQKRVVGSGMDLLLPRGKLTALLGSNGSGKSTLIRTLAGLQPPLEGSVSLGARDIRDWKTGDLAREIAVVLQEPVRNTNLNVFELVSLGRTPYTDWLGNLDAKDRDKTFESLEKTGISHLADRKTAQLSDGEWQKAMFAKALAQDTPIILLDEPTAHLDLLSRIELIQMLHRAAAAGSKSILFSTHDLELALRMADHLWLLNGKGAMHAGAPEDLVLRGYIAETYSKAGDVGFDTRTGHIRVPAPGYRQEIRLSGTGPEFFWTRKALERTGYPTVDTAGNAALAISVTRKKESILWEIYSGGGIFTAESIGSLLEKLEEISARS